MTRAPVLVVDDEEPVRRILERLLDRAGYAPVGAADAAEARDRLCEADFALMLCDVTMPGESGLSLLAHVAQRHPDTAVIMVTAVDDPAAAGPMGEHGVYGYVLKPFEPNEILCNVAGAMRRRELELEQRDARALLERRVLERTAALQDAVDRLGTTESALRASYEESVLRLAKVAEWRDPHTGTHLAQMSALSGRLAALAGLDEERVDSVRIASLMHDIGKIAIPDEVLLKPGALTADERLVMQRHAEIGAQMLDGSASPLLCAGALVALTHHERWDGTGYPRGLSGTAIPLEGRIVAVADVFDALTSVRPYKPAWPLERAVDTLRASRGSQLDPELVDLFVADVLGG